MKMIYIVEFGKISEKVGRIDCPTMKQAVIICEQLELVFHGKICNNWVMAKNEPRKSIVSSTHHISLRKFNGIFPHN